MILHSRLPGTACQKPPVALCDRDLEEWMRREHVPGITRAFPCMSLYAPRAIFVHQMMHIRIPTVYIHPPASQP